MRPGAGTTGSRTLRRSGIQRPARRAGVALALLGAAIGSMAPPAAADPAGPTDYETTVIGIDPPPDDEFRVEIVGGDSFVLLSVTPGSEVEVLGYQGEPYLRFGPDGTVLRNDRSPSRWLNDDRFGDGDVPAEATAGAAPDWREVGNGGRYAWHDHRAHWMNPQKPPGVEPGDVVLEAVIPLRVDGEAVEIEVRSVLLAPPSPLAPMVGAVLGAGTMILAASSRRPWALPVLMGAWSVAATVLGLWAWSSMPVETEPSLLLWLPALIAAVVAAAALVAHRDGTSAERGSTILTVGLALGGVELVVWALLRRTAVTRAFIPGAGPEVVDRAVIVGAGVAGAAALVVATHRVLRSGPIRLAPAGT